MYGTAGTVMEHSVTVLLLTRRGNFRFTFTGMIFIPVKVNLKLPRRVGEASIITHLSSIYLQSLLFDETTFIMYSTGITSTDDAIKSNNFKL